MKNKLFILLAAWLLIGCTTLKPSDIAYAKNEKYGIMVYNKRGNDAGVEFATRYSYFNDTLYCINHRGDTTASFFNLTGHLVVVKRLHLNDTIR
ncbi:MAG: hypothetical protein V4651_01175 [Bacteroidota bacterium]